YADDIQTLVPLKPARVEAILLRELLLDACAPECYGRSRPANRWLKDLALCCAIPRRLLHPASPVRNRLWVQHLGQSQRTERKTPALHQVQVSNPLLFYCADRRQILPH